MDFGLDERRAAVQERVREFCADELSEEREAELDRTGEFPREMYAGMAERGLFAIPFPEEYGGLGGDILDVVLTVERLAARSNTATYMFLVPVIFGGMIVLLCGTREQREELLPRLVSGELMFSFALTEPQAGSDIRSIRTAAARREGGWSVTGTKYWTTGATVADYLLVVALTDTGSDPSHGMSIFLVPGSSPGIGITPIPKLAGSAFPSCEVVLEEVFVDESAVLGGAQAVNGGWMQLLGTADLERICIAASCVGAAGRVLDDSVAYAKEREQFNRPIFKFQAMQHKLADMATTVDSMRWMTYHAAWMKAAGMSCFKEVCMSKLYCSESLADITRMGMQVMGGRGYSTDCPMERYMREGLLAFYAGGTSDIQRNIIARFL